MKTYYLTALSFEAEPLIKARRMKCEISDGPFRIYAGENDVLVISGVGDLAASAATAFMCGKYSPGEGDIFINFGTCGAVSGSLKVGDLTYARSVGRDGNRTLYTDLFFDFSDNSIKTVEIPRDICEMEAYGAAFAAMKFFSADRIFILKAVSDIASETKRNGGKIDRETAFSTACSAAGKIVEFVGKAAEFYLENTDKPYEFTENEQKMLQNAAEKLKLSFQDRKILENYFWKNKLLGKDFGFYPDEVKNRKQGEIILKRTVAKND